MMRGMMVAEGAEGEVVAEEAAAVRTTKAEKPSFKSKTLKVLISISTSLKNTL
jgi:hypothetical protein